jgi:cytochrome c553
MLYNRVSLCHNGQLFLPLLSNGEPVFATRELSFMSFRRLVATIVFCLGLILNGSVYADVAAGQSTYSARGCIGCHGAGGKSTVPTYPSLQGKDADFMLKNLTDFRSGARANPTMNAMAAGLSDADINDLAAYIDSLK